MNKPTDPTLLSPENIERTCAILYFNRWLITICLLTGLAAAIAIYRLTPTTYPSEAKLLVRYVSEAIPIASSSGASVVAPGVNVINSEIAILESRDQIEKVVNNIGVKRFGLDGTNALQRALALRNAILSLNVTAANNSNVISLRYEGPDPALSQDFLTSLIQHYLEKHSEIHRDAGAYEFLSKQTDQLRARLSDTEAELRALKTDTGVISLVESEKAALEKIEALERQQREAETALAASEAKVSVMYPALSMTATNTRAVMTAPSQPALSTGYYLLLERLKQLQNREAELLYSYMASSGPVQSIRTQIVQIQKELEQEGNKRPTTPLELTNVITSAGSQDWHLALRSEEAEVAALRAKIEVIKKQLTQAQSQSKHLATLDERMVQLERNKELQEQNYRYFSKRLEQARVDNALDAAKISSVVVIQPPSFPISKYRNKVPQKMSLALVLGLSLGLGLAFTRETIFNTSIKRPSEVSSRLGLPLFLAIPFLNPKSVHEQLHPYCEALRDRVLAATATSDNRPYLLGIAGCHSGAGASTLASGLASAMARNNDGHILIVDAAVAHSSSHRLLSQDPTAGMTSLIGDEKGNTVVLQPNLYMLSSYEATDRPPQINLMQGISGWIRNLSQSQYRYIIFDLPPVNDISTSLRFAPELDGLLLVLASGEGSLVQATQARDLISQTGLSIIGTILNKTKPFMPSFLTNPT